MGLLGYLYNAFNGRGFSFTSLLSILVAYAVIIFIALPFHELAHGFVADKLGDRTARVNRRLTFNPIRHLDPLGVLMLIIAGIGYAKPVPVNPRNFHNYKQGVVLVSLAGPVSNLLMAFVVMAIYRVVFLFLPVSGILTALVGYFFTYLIYINIALAAFNLLPLPPLDGYRAVSVFLPKKWTFTIDQNFAMVRLVVIILAVSGALASPISLISNAIYNLFAFILRF